MLSFRCWLAGRIALNERSIPTDVIKVQLPNVRQQTNYSCGAACMRCVFAYFGIKVKDENDLIKALDTTEKNGTNPQNMVTLAKKLGFRVKEAHGMTIKDLRRWLDKHVPVVCAMQAYGNPSKYHTYANGHYIIAIGYDDDKIYFEDPSLENGRRAFLSNEEFEKRWHDVDGYGNKYEHYGIAVWKHDPKPRKKHLRTAKRID